MQGRRAGSRATADRLRHSAGSVYDLPMEVTKYTHACIRIEHDGGILVIDPGVWSEPRALAGATAVLLTHEHADHVDVLRLRGLGVPVHAPVGAKIDGVRLEPIQAGDTLEIDGLGVRAVGGRHATIHAGRPDCANLGYIVDERMYHPGDSLFVPDDPIEILFSPAHGGWLKLTEAIDFVKAIRPERAIAIHDAQINRRGLASAIGWLTDESGVDYRWVEPGTVI